MLDFAASYKNDPSRKGQLAARKQLFGEFSRYAVAPVHTRFAAVQWFVWDAHTQTSKRDPAPATSGKRIRLPKLSPAWNSRLIGGG